MKKLIAHILFFLCKMLLLRGLSLPFVITYVIILTIVEYAINMIVNKMSKADRCLNIRFSVKSISLFNS